ncbi:hypothetical protein CS542_10115 [Pedobacter sp. IW39]|nr:hypothetical protein CS542_10115 [Pedobacter sp. IW39]
MGKKVSAEAKYELEHVLQELMVNMSKHSKANNVAVRFEYKDNYLNVCMPITELGFRKDTI